MHAFTRDSLIRIKGVLSALATVGLGLAMGACASLDREADTLSRERIAQIVASADRSAADKQNDIRRKPEAMLAFLGLRPGMLALDVSAGGGYTSELLARALGPTGKVYAQSQPREMNRQPATPVAPEGNSHPSAVAGNASVPAASAAPTGPSRTSAVAIAERQRLLAASGVPAAPMVAVPQRFDDPVPAVVLPGTIDVVTLMFNYHDLGHMGVDRDRMNRALFAALKSGGMYVIADHAGRPGTGIGEAGTLHRIEEAFLRAEVERAGFRLAASADFLRNPQDPRDRNTPVPAMPKDEFVLKFVKP